MRAARAQKVPFVTTYHGAYGEREPFKRFYNSVMARGDRVIANSHYTAALVRERHNPASEQMVVIYRGVDLSRFNQAAVSEQRLDALRQEWGLKPNNRLVLHPARLTYWKGQLTVIEAAAQLLKQPFAEDVVVVLAGDHQDRDDYLNGLRQDIDAVGLADRILVPGHCSDMAAAYALAEVTLIASIEPEAFGRTSAEAQAMGCPVIATNIGAPPETVRACPPLEPEQTTGWLVPPGDSNALAAALEEALTLKDDVRAQMAARAIANVRDNYSDQRMKRDTLAVYDALLGTQMTKAFDASCSESVETA
jgi:glycosyltransferase involved in cell wall biosynthesis